jgi:hypothetical protein
MSHHEHAAPMPDLRIVPLSALAPHEEHDAQRSQPLLERIRQAGTWLNPPIVAPMDEEHFVILDGANRCYCVEALGYPYILVQVVDYDSDAVELDTWHHVVSKLTWFELLRGLREVAGIRVESSTLLDARVALAQREVVAYATLSDGRAYTLAAEADTLAERNSILRAIVNSYKQRGTLNRINTDSLRAARELYPDAVAIIVFPQYQPVEIIVAARDHAFLPPGITRHVIHGRAMRLHYPLGAFEENGETLAQKNAHLRIWMQERSAHKRIRYYAESSYLFDE